MLQTMDEVDYGAIYNRLYACGYHDHEHHSWMGEKSLPWLFRLGDWNTFLDVGCANGASVRYVENREKVGVGLDISSLGVEKGRWMGQDLRVASATEIPFKDWAFDVVASSDTLEHLTEEDVRKAAAEMARVCRKYLIIRVCPKADVTRRWRKINKGPLHLCVKPIIWWKNLFKQYGSIVWEDGWDFAVRVKQPTLCVVGNGGSSRDRNLGETVDSHDLVARFNNYKLTREVGTKENIWIHHHNRDIVARNHSKYTEVVLATNDKKARERAWPVVRDKAIRSYRVYASATRDLLPVPKGLTPGERRWWSTGLVSMLYLLQAWDRITVVGFDHFKGGVSHHYWGPKREVRYLMHNGATEKEVFDHFERLGRIVRA